MPPKLHRLQKCLHYDNNVECSVDVLQSRHRVTHVLCVVPIGTLLVVHNCAVVFIHYQYIEREGSILLRCLQSQE